MKKITNVFTAFIMLLGQALSVANVFATRTISAPDTGIMTKESASAIESDILTMFSMFALFGVAIIITKKISL